MSAPEKLVVRYNGADAVEDYRSIGRTFRPRQEVDTALLLDVWAIYITKFGNFPVTRLDTGEAISVKPIERLRHALVLQSRLGELFEAPYTVADDPKPRAVLESDINFQLLLTTASRESE